MVSMPTLPMDTIQDIFEPHEIALIKETVKNDGELRSSKPRKGTGRGQFLWRQLVFGLSTNPRHHCIPTTDQFDLMNELKDWDKVRAESKVLSDLAVRVEALVPIEQRHGTLKWGRALGVL